MIAHTALLVLTWLAVAAVAAGVLALAWRALEARVAARRSEDQRCAVVTKRLGRGSPWVTLPRSAAPRDLGLADAAARDAGFRLLGIERSRGPLRRPVLVFVPLRGPAAELLAEPESAPRTR